MGCLCLHPNEQEQLTEVDTKQHNFSESDLQFKSKSLRSDTPCLDNTDQYRNETNLNKENNQIDLIEKATSEVVKEDEDKQQQQQLKPEQPQIVQPEQEPIINQKVNQELTVNEPKENEDFSQELLKHINKMRTNPRKYADYIEDSMIHIEVSKDKLIYSDRVKVRLEKGIDAFNEASEALRVIPSMSPLVLKEDLCVKPPEKDQFYDKNYLSHQVDIIKSRIAIKSYWNYQVSIPEVAVLLMVVSDTRSAGKKKRNDLLNANFKYIGISSASFGKVFNSYLTFTD